MAILRYIYPILSVVLLTGCYEDFNPEIDTKPVLCLNSLITAGEPIEVKVTHTWIFNDEKSEKNHDVKDATVSIFVNGSIVGADYIPEEGDEIKIIADSPTYGTATAEVTVPYATPIGNVKVTPKVKRLRASDDDYYKMLIDMDFNLEIEMDIDDPAGTDNFYKYEYDWYDSQSLGYPVSQYEVKLSPGRLQYDYEPIFREHVGVFDDLMSNGEDGDFYFFTDRQFPGKSYTLHLDYQDNYFRVDSREYKDCLLECGITLRLISVSQSYYNWEVYKWNADEGIVGDFSDIGFAEPKWGYSNVSTGAGVVAACSRTNYTVTLKHFFEQILNSSNILE